MHHFSWKTLPYLKDINICMRLSGYYIGRLCAALQLEARADRGGVLPCLAMKLIVIWYRVVEFGQATSAGLKRVELHVNCAQSDKP